MSRHGTTRRDDLRDAGVEPADEEPVPWPPAGDREMDDKHLDTRPADWVGLDRHLVIRLRPDGTYHWEANSHPALGREDVIGQVRERCNVLERAIGEIDARLRSKRGLDADEELNALLDRRKADSDQLRFLRDFLRHMAEGNVPG